MPAKLFFDCETTGLIGTSAAEPIEIYFAVFEKNKIVDEYTAFVCPEKWEPQAELVHKIPHEVASSYPNKNQALEEFIKWCPKKLDCYSYVNTNVGYNFDQAVLRLWFFDCDRLFDYYKLFNTHRFISVLNLVREAVRKGAVDSPRVNGKVSYTLQSVYKNYTCKNFNAHNAREDVHAMIEVFQYLQEKLASNKESHFGF